MRSAKAIFIKQVHDLFKNPAVLIQLIVFPVIAFIFTEFMGAPPDNTPRTMFITMFAAMSTGLTLLTMTTLAIAEDREHKSLRFLVMAGVKPYSYLLGIGGVVFVAGLLESVVFGSMGVLMGGFELIAFLKFILILTLGSVASVLLGATLGIFCKNQQAATSIALPIAMVLGFGPMLTMFNDTIGKVFSVTYTQQLNIVVNDLSASMTKPLLIIVANIALFFILFVLAFTKKGLKN